MTYTVYMPKGADEESWRLSPVDWEPELRRKRKIGKDGCADFCVADILASKDTKLSRNGGIRIKEPPGTNFVVAFVDGEPSDQAGSLKEVVARIRQDLADWDWPMEVSFVFWRHHKRYERHRVREAKA